MTEADIKSIIQRNGGGCHAVDYATALLEKINRLKAIKGYVTMLDQLQATNDQGEFRGRLLELNFADCFARRGIVLQYGAKQGMSGDIDFCWSINGDRVFVKLKLLGQDRHTRDDTAKKLEESGFCEILHHDDTTDIARIQLDILDKASNKKFNPRPDPTWINLVAIDVSELQLGMVDIGDCLLAVGGNDFVKRHYDESYQRRSVVGIFERESVILTAEQVNWVSRWRKKLNDNGLHPREYIHGILFLFRLPKEQAALSYDLRGIVVWNLALIERQRAKSFLDAFHQIISEPAFPYCNSHTDKRTPSEFSGDLR